MTQEQNSQTTDSNSNLIEHVNEEELQDITGGCVYCAGVAFASAAELGTSLANAVNTGSTKEAAKAVVHAGIVFDSANHFTGSLRPCQTCVTNTGLYLATKSK